MNFAAKGTGHTPLIISTQIKDDKLAQLVALELFSAVAIFDASNVLGETFESLCKSRRNLEIILLKHRLQTKVTTANVMISFIPFSTSIM